MAIEMNTLVSSTSEIDRIQEEMGTLEQVERCLDACGFGRYQWGLLGISFVGVLANAFVMVNSHYVLNIMDEKHYEEYGHILYVMLLFGIILSSVFFGFLSDCFGRRKITILSFAGLTVATLFKSAVRNYEIKIFAKICEGIFLGGASVASITLQAEFQPEKSRDRIMFTLNFFITISYLLVILADVLFVSVLFNDYVSSFFGDRPWDIYVSMTSLVSLIACLLYALLPESPKCDFNHGRYKNSLQTLKRIYSVNTGKSGDEFPYQLLGMTDNEFRTRGDKVLTTWTKLKLLFKNPLLKYIIVIMAAHFSFTFGYNTMRLWRPTLLSVIGTASKSNSTFLCDAFDERQMDISHGRFGDYAHYIENYVGLFVFGLIPYIGIIIFINRAKKLILLLSICLCCSLTISMYWINVDFVNVLVFGIFLATGQHFSGLIQAIVVEIFPVYTKSISLSLVLTANTIGVILAEVMILSLLQYGCALGFIVAAMMACAAVFILFLSK